MNERENNRSAILIYILAMAIWGSIGIFRRSIPLPSALLAGCRGITGALFLILLLRLRKKPFLLPQRKLTGLLLIISGALIGLNWILLFEAYNYTSVPTATLCYYMSPVIVILASPFLFQERITPRKGICAVMAVIGMVLVSGVLENVNAGTSQIKGISFGLGAALIYGSVVILNKKITGIDPYVKTIIQLLSSLFAVIPYIILTGQSTDVQITPQAVLLILVLGIIHTGTAYAMYFHSMERLPAQTAAILSYIDPITSLILSALILNEHLSVYGIIGAVLIIVSALLSDI